MNVFVFKINHSGEFNLQTRILVTHSVTFLHRVDFIVVLNHGSVSEYGSFEQLLENKGDFSEFLVTYLEQNSESDEEG